MSDFGQTSESFDKEHQVIGVDNLRGRQHLKL